jgi:hypothetical protein
MVKINKYKDMIKKIIDETEIEDKIELYKKNNADSTIIDILQKKTNNRIMMEDIIAGIFSFDNSTHTEHDKQYKGKKIEIKTSTLLNKDLKKNKYTFQYFGIHSNYDWDYLILCNIWFDELKFYIVDKKTFTDWKLFDKQKNYKILNFERVKITELTLENINSLLA